MNEDGYPSYRRRLPEDGGVSYEKELHNKEKMTVDNRWVVPYSPLLSRAFNAHVNVEWCNSVKSIKYVTKYINKVSINNLIHPAIQHFYCYRVSKKIVPSRGI